MLLCQPLIRLILASHCQSSSHSIMTLALALELNYKFPHTRWMLRGNNLLHIPTSTSFEISHPIFHYIKVMCHNTKKYCSSISTNVTYSNWHQNSIFWFLLIYLPLPFKQIFLLKPPHPLCEFGFSLHFLKLCNPNCCPPLVMFSKKVPMYMHWKWLHKTIMLACLFISD